MAEPIVEIPFGLWAQVGSRNHVMGVQIAPCKWAIFLGEITCPGMPDSTAMSCARMAELIEMLFGLWTQMGPWNLEACVTLA